MVEEECFKQGKKEVEKVIVNRVHVLYWQSPYQEKKRSLSTALLTWLSIITGPESFPIWLRYSI